jgi:hypothetical protein
LLFGKKVRFFLVLVVCGFGVSGLGAPWWFWRLLLEGGGAGGATLVTSTPLLLFVSSDGGDLFPDLLLVFGQICFLRWCFLWVWWWWLAGCGFVVVRCGSGGLVWFWCCDGEFRWCGGGCRRFVCGIWWVVDVVVGYGVKLVWWWWWWW